MKKLAGLLSVTAALLLALALPQKTYTQTASVLFGTFGGVPKAVAADTSGNLSVTIAAGTASPNILCVDATNKDACIQRQASGIANLTAGAAGTTFSRLNFGTALVGNPSLKVSGTALHVRLADDSAFAPLSAGAITGTGTASITGSFFVSGAGNGLGVGNISIINQSPTISSGFGSSPSIVSPNGSLTFRVNVGTGGVATSGVLGLPTAGTGWNCTPTDMTTNIVTRETSSTTTTVTLTAASAWVASDILLVQCFAF